MKWTTVAICALLIVSVYSKLGDPPIRTGPELLKYMYGDLQGTYIIMFFKKSAPESRTSSMRKEVKEKILNKYPDFHYHEADVDSGTYNDVVDNFRVDMVELKFSPTLMVASEGRGYWSHGEDSVTEIVGKLDEFSGELRRQK